MKLTAILAIPIALVITACTAASPTPSPATPAPTAATAAPATPAATAAPATPAATASPELGDIVAVAQGAGTFNTLLQAAQVAGLVDTLRGPGPYTVFAPTDDAFAALPEGTLDSLLADPAALKKVLLYHVVSGDVMAVDVVNETSADTVEGSPIAITVKDGKVYLNDSTQVTATDILASNGVIHVIDQVLLPPATN